MLMTPIELSIFISRVESICQEMGVVLRRAAFSPNIKDRLDFSCALFDCDGELFAQAAHIPVHLGSMAYAMSGIVADLDWKPGDVLVLNDPFLGGTHLPDVTLVSPLFQQSKLVAFVANRAHHANIGAKSPGSMPISQSLEEEGLLIPPTFLVRAGKPVSQVMAKLASIDDGEAVMEGTVFGDFSAQISANGVGLQRLGQLLEAGGQESFLSGIGEINDYGERLARHSLSAIPAGVYSFCDVLDDDGCGNKDIVIATRIEVAANSVELDFSGTSPQVEGNVNCPISVAAAAVYYVFRCLLPQYAPACAGTFRCISIQAPQGSLINARRPAAVAAGNVETSMRIVDVVLGALVQAIPDSIPAASQGTMNNVAMGSRGDGGFWDYYETVAGGSGGHSLGPGLAAVQCHMTNTLNTPIESVEMHYPLRIRRYQLRDGSGGAGLHRGGDGLIREFEFLATTDVTLLTERRTHAPWGLAGGESGQAGINLLNGQPLPGKCQFTARVGDRLTIISPGGGGWRSPQRTGQSKDIKSQSSAKIG